MIQNLRENVAWRAIPLAGLAGGTIFLLTLLLLSPAWLGIDDAVILYYFASLIMGTDVLLEHNGGVLLVGIVVHYMLSILFAFLIALVVHRWGMAIGIIGGAILGASLYGINLYTMTLFFPWFYAINSLLLLLGHVLYGAVVGGVYEAFDQYDITHAQRTEVTHEAA